MVRALSDPVIFVNISFSVVCRGLSIIAVCSATLEHGKGKS